MITGIKINSMQINFSTSLTDNERLSEVKKYKSFYSSKRDNKGNKIKIETIKL